MNRFRMLTATVTQVALVAAFTLGVGHAKSNGGRDGIKVEDLREWLTYLSSDDLEGRNTYTEGLGLAAGYISAQLKSWGIKPGGPNGSYFQRVPVQGIKVESQLRGVVPAAPEDLARLIQIDWTKINPARPEWINRWNREIKV